VPDVSIAPGGTAFSSAAEKVIGLSRERAPIRRSWMLHTFGGLSESRGMITRRASCAIISSTTNVRPTSRLSLPGVGEVGGSAPGVESRLRSGGISMSSSSTVTCVTCRWSSRNALPSAVNRLMEIKGGTSRRPRCRIVRPTPSA
jgi:hypothetical protein